MSMVSHMSAVAKLAAQSANHTDSRSAVPTTISPRWGWGRQMRAIRRGHDRGYAAGVIVEHRELLARVPQSRAGVEPPGCDRTSCTSWSRPRGLGSTRVRSRKTTLTKTVGTSETPQPARQRSGPDSPGARVRRRPALGNRGGDHELLPYLGGGDAAYVSAS